MVIAPFHAVHARWPRDGDNARREQAHLRGRGGGRVRGGGEAWEVGADLTAVDGMLFNNPRPVVMSSGGELDGFFTVFGWEGPHSIGRDSTAPGGGNRGKAYLYGDGEWRCGKVICPGRIENYRITKTLQRGK